MLGVTSFINYSLEPEVDTGAHYASKWFFNFYAMLLLLNNYGYCNAIVILYDFKTPPGVGNNIGMTRHCFYYMYKHKRSDQKLMLIISFYVCVFKSR